MDCTCTLQCVCVCVCVLAVVLVSTVCVGGMSVCVSVCRVGGMCTHTHRTLCLMLEITFSLCPAVE